MQDAEKLEPDAGGEPAAIYPRARLGYIAVHQASGLFETHLFGYRSPSVAFPPPSRYGLFGVALRRVTVAIGL